MAARNIVRQPRRSIIVASTAAVGLLCVTLSQGFINGFIDSMLFVSIESGLGHVQIRPQGYIDTRQPGMRLIDADKIRIKLENKQYKKLNYAERIETEALLRSGTDTKGILLLGLDAGAEKKVSNMSNWIVEGTFLPDAANKVTHANSVKNTQANKHVCLLGKKNAKDLELELGDWFVITTGRENASSISFRCTIVGIFRSPSQIMDQRMILMPKNQISTIRFGNPDQSSYFVFLGEDYTKAGALKTQIEHTIRSFPTANTYSYSEMEPFINTYFEMTNQFTWIMYTVILIGFGIVLFESVTMSIFERTHEIGIMHALGAGKFFLFWLIIFEAFLLTLAGALLSLIPGLLLMGLLSWTGVNFEGFNMNEMSWMGSPGTVYPYVTFQNILTGIKIAIIVSFFSGIYPALRAVRLSPVKAIYNR